MDGIEEVDAARRRREPISSPASDAVAAGRDAVAEPAGDAVRPVVELFAEPPRALRAIRANLSSNLQSRRGAPSRVRLIAFASGRGGTGRSLLAANVAVYLAQAAKKVVAIDADPAGGPLHQLLGAARPPRGFGEFLRGKAAGLNELIVDTPIAGVGLIGGEGSTFGASRPKQTAKGTLAAIAALDVDYVIVDLGPADSTLTIDLWLGADVPVLVTLPDPASIDSIYRFAKSAFVRRLRTRARPRPTGEQRDRPAARRARSLPRGARGGRSHGEVGAGDPALSADVRGQSDPHGPGPQARHLDLLGGAAAARDTPSTISGTSSRTRPSGWRRDAIARWSPSTPRGRPRRTSSGWGGGCCHWKTNAIARRRRRCGSKRSRPTTRSWRPSPASATKRSAAPTGRSRTSTPRARW